MRTLKARSKFWRKMPACVAVSTLCLSILPQPASGMRPLNQQENRPRRVDGQRAEVADDGPSVRVGLMTDVSSVILSSIDKLAVRPSADDGSPTILAGQLRVEVGHGQLRETKPAYRVEVAEVSDRRRAVKIT